MLIIPSGAYAEGWDLKQRKLEQVSDAKDVRVAQGEI